MTSYHYTDYRHTRLCDNTTAFCTEKHGYATVFICISCQRPILTDPQFITGVLGLPMDRVNTITHICRKQTSFNIQHIYGRRQYGHRFKVTCDISPTISGWLLVSSVTTFCSILYQAQNGDMCRILAGVMLSAVFQFEAAFYHLQASISLSQTCNSYSIFSCKFLVVGMSKEFINHF